MWSYVKKENLDKKENLFFFFTYRFYVKIYGFFIQQHSTKATERRLPQNDRVLNCLILEMLCKWDGSRTFSLKRVIQHYFFYTFLGVCWKLRFLREVSSVKGKFLGVGLVVRLKFNYYGNVYI